MTITKIELLNLYSSMKKINPKYSDDFLLQKLTLKVKFWHFLTPPFTPIRKIQLFHLTAVDF